MAYFDSEKSVFQIDDTGSSLRDLSTYINDIGGLPGPRGLSEITALGDGGAKWIPTIENVQISLAGTYHDASTTGPDEVLGALRTHSRANDFDYGPEGSSASSTKYSGTCWVSTYEVQSRVGDAVRWSATLQVEGKVTRGAYT